jgi:carbamate kinase
VIALGGNALLQRGQPMTMENQQANIADAIKNLRNVLEQNSITFVHGNGPQVGMLVLEDAAYHGNKNSQTLDVLDAETEGMIGYLLEQELDNVVDKGTVTVLSQIVVDPKDPAFQKPTKFIGPVYTQEEAQSLLKLKPQPDGVYWKGNNDTFFKRDGDKIRRVVPSPVPQRLVELDAIRLLIENDFIVICAGGGGIPVTYDGKLKGVEAVIDKDRAATMLGMALGAHGLMILTDVPAVAINYDTPTQKWIKSVSPQRLDELMENFPDGSMGPKVSSAIEFTKFGGWCTIGSLKEANEMMAREAGTLVTNEHGQDHIEYY